jgi:hypothetical protein
MEIQFKGEIDSDKQKEIVDSIVAELDSKINPKYELKVIGPQSIHPNDKVDDSVETLVRYELMVEENGKEAMIKQAAPMQRQELNNDQLGDLLSNRDIQVEQTGYSVIVNQLDYEKIPNSLIEDIAQKLESWGFELETYYQDILEITQEEIGLEGKDNYVTEFIFKDNLTADDHIASIKQSEFNIHNIESGDTIIDGTGYKLIVLAYDPRGCFLKNEDGEISYLPWQDIEKYGKEIVKTATSPYMKPRPQFAGDIEAEIVKLKKQLDQKATKINEILEKDPNDTNNWAMGLEEEMDDISYQIDNYEKTLKKASGTKGKYKSDKDIANEFSGFEIKSVTVNEYKGTDWISGQIEIRFPAAGESVAGGMEGDSTITDRWIAYDYKEWIDNGKRWIPKLGWDHWYPENVETAMEDAIVEKLNTIDESMVKLAAKKTKSELLVNYDTSDWASSYIEDIKANWDEYKEYIVKDSALVADSKPEDYKDEIETYAYNDQGYYDILFEDITSDFDSTFNGIYEISASNMGWRQLSGEKIAKIEGWDDLVNKVLPKTSELTVKVYKGDADGELSMVVYHHDAPTGESYYFRPAKPIPNGTKVNVTTRYHIGGEAVITDSDFNSTDEVFEYWVEYVKDKDTENDLIESDFEIIK